jgi:hypothetical protein
MWRFLLASVIPAVPINDYPLRIALTDIVSVLALVSFRFEFSFSIAGNPKGGREIPKPAARIGCR